MGNINFSLCGSCKVSTDIPSPKEQNKEDTFNPIKYILSTDEKTETWRLRSLSTLKAIANKSSLVEKFVIPQLQSLIEGKTLNRGTFCFNNNFEIEEVDSSVENILNWSDSKNCKNDLGWTINIHSEDIDQVVLMWIETKLKHTVFVSKFRVYNEREEINFVISYCIPRFDAHGQFLTLEGHIFQIEEDAYKNIQLE